MGSLFQRPGLEGREIKCLKFVRSFPIFLFSSLGNPGLHLGPHTELEKVRHLIRPFPVSSFQDPDRLM